VAKKECRFRQQSLRFLHEQSNIAALGRHYLKAKVPVIVVRGDTTSCQSDIVRCVYGVKLMRLCCDNRASNYFRQGTSQVVHLTIYCSEELYKSYAVETVRILGLGTLQIWEVSLRVR
jgi:hypothetical protein